jgi:hypothetical protein
VPQFKSSGARFEQQRREDEEVLAAHERDLDVAPPAEAPLEVPRRGDATKPSAQHDNAPLHETTRVASRPTALA